MLVKASKQTEKHKSATQTMHALNIMPNTVVQIQNTTAAYNVQLRGGVNILLEFVLPYQKNTTALM